MVAICSIAKSPERYRKVIKDPWDNPGNKLFTSCSQNVRLPCFFIFRFWLRMHGTDMFRHGVDFTWFHHVSPTQTWTQMHPNPTGTKHVSPTCGICRIYHQILLETSGNHQSPNCTHCSMQRFQCLQIIGLQCCITSAWRLRSTESTGSDLGALALFAKVWLLFKK